MENAKQDSMSDMSVAILEKQDHRCLLLTDNKALKNSVQHVCDSVSNLTIDPLIHLRNWTKQNILVYCKHKGFNRIYQINNILVISKAYEIVKKYRTPENNDTELAKVSNALDKLAYFFYNQQLLQIHQDKTKSCEARAELDVWYKASGYDNNPELSKQIINLKLDPFPTKANQ